MQMVGSNMPGPTATSPLAPWQSCLDFYPLLFGLQKWWPGKQAFYWLPGRRVSRQERQWHWSFCWGITRVGRGSDNIDYLGCHLDHALGQDKPSATRQCGPQGGFVLGEKLQPAPAVCISPSETTARAEGGWQPCGDPAVCPQALQQGRNCYEFHFLTK